MNNAGDLDAPKTSLQVRLEADVESRLDRALAASDAALAAALSRERIKALIVSGAVGVEGPHGVRIVTDPAARVSPGLYVIDVPSASQTDARPQDLPLVVIFEDAHLIVVDKPAGMAAHPGPGTPDGTLVNALLHHCAGSLSGIGGVERPGIVHRLDKDTSGVMVAAKTDAAHQGLAALFARHDLERAYIAFTRTMPTPGEGRIETRIGRSTHDRKKMAVLKAGGREAITDYRVEATFGVGKRLGDLPLAARVRCRLETGRTHQIRVHMAHKGSPILGDPVYGSGSSAQAVKAAIAEAGLQRQALHAAVLGFVHPITGEALHFETAPPPDMQRLEALLQAL